MHRGAGGRWWRRGKKRALLAGRTRASAGGQRLARAGQLESRQRTLGREDKAGCVIVRETRIGTVGRADGLEALQGWGAGNGQIAFRRPEGQAWVANGGAN